MRTKTLLITAALTAAGALSSMAQVYSVNIVGYVNLPIPVGFSMIANQLNNSPNNQLNTLLPPGTGPQPGGVFIYKFNGASFDQEFYDAGLGAWSGAGPSIPPGTTTLNPGEGAFIFAPAAFTATFVGEVQLTSTLTIPTGFSIISSVIPQAGPLYDPAGGADLGFGVPQQLETIYQFTGSAYNQAFWDAGLVAWQGPPTMPASGPSVAVGEAFWNFNNPNTGGGHTWARTFVVGPP